LPESEARERYGTETLPELHVGDPRAELTKRAVSARGSPADPGSASSVVEAGAAGGLHQQLFSHAAKYCHDGGMAFAD
jgi:hypothetical protein